jgi:hypothetical protein
MLQRRLHRRLVAWLLAFCVIFAQSAALAYACQRQVEPETATGALCAAHLKDGADVGVGAPLADANVCEVHCHDASLPDTGAVDVPLPDDVVAWALPQQAVAFVPTAPATELEAKSASPPSRALFVRLLI